MTLKYSMLNLPSHLPHSLSSVWAVFCDRHKYGGFILTGSVFPSTLLELLSYVLQHKVRVSPAVASGMRLCCGYFQVLRGLKYLWCPGSLVQSMIAARDSGKGGGMSLAVHKRMPQRKKDVSLTLEQKLELRARSEPGTSLLRWFNVWQIGKAKDCWPVRGELRWRQKEWNFPFWRGSSSDGNKDVLSKLLSGVTCLGYLSNNEQEGQEQTKLCALPSDKRVWDFTGGRGGSPCLSQDTVIPVFSCLPHTLLFWMQTVFKAFL